jgi:hypothetical protein
MNIETWKVIKDYPNVEISTFGNIRNINTKKVYAVHERNGYLAKSFYYDKQSKTINIHTLVAKTFIENPLNKPVVNHKDGNRKNNNINNLEWTTIKENNQHALDTGLNKKNKKKVGKYLNDELITIYDSIKEAAKENNMSDKHIGTVCRGKRKNAGGFNWKYIDFCIETLTDDEMKTAKEIKDFPNYLISQSGKIYSKKLKACMTIKTLESGYNLVQLSNNNLKKDFYIHVLMKEYFK